MIDFSAGASPFVVWEGSQEVIRETFIEAYKGVAAGRWSEMDVTALYHKVRRKIFDCCERIEIHAGPGEAYLVHRLALHGIAPWQSGASASADGRLICYLRPEIGGPEDWLFNP